MQRSYIDGQVRFTSPMLRVNQLNELFMRAHEMVEIDSSEDSEHPNATIIDQLNWSSEEVLANQCEHIDYADTLDGAKCNDCGLII